MNPHFHVIKDPVHGTLQFSSQEDAWVKPFINSPHFQRLRHIKQLGMGDYIFPGAVHTRFNHCIGCCYVGSQIANKIGLVEEERQLVMIACLLHDIGHGPFSHAFEDIFYQKLIRHEDWTPYFLSSFHSDHFFHAYNVENPRYSLTEEKFHQIADMIMHKKTSKPVLADIVSSQLDADRLDYLLRDSHFCGVRYGEFDFRWMLHCMTIVRYQNKERLGITHKGIGVVEHYLMARRLMMRNIYKSQKKLAIEFLLIKLLSLLSTLITDNANYKTLRHTNLGKFLIAIHQFNQTAETQGDNTSLKIKFLTENYQLYETLCDYDIFYLIRDLASRPQEDAITKLAVCLHDRKIPKIFRLDHLDSKEVQLTLKEFKLKYRQKYEDWQIGLITIPHQSYSGEDPILVTNEQRAVKPIDEFSIMLEAIADKYEHMMFLCVDRNIIDENEVRLMLTHFNHNDEVVDEVYYGS